MIGAIVPPRDRGRWQGLIGSVFAAASILGPAVGGFIVDNASWRWIFLVNLPVGGAALVAVSLTLPKRDGARRALDRLARRGAARRRDRRAAARRSSGAAATTAGGASTCSARSPSRRCCSPRSRSSSGAPREPILPFEILAQPDRGRERRVHGARRDGDVRDDLVRAAVRAGRDRHLGDVVRRRAHAADARRGRRPRSSPGSSISRTGHYRWNVARRPGVLTLGMALLWRMNVDTTNGEAARNMVVAGIGIGSMMQVFVLSVQNAVARARIGAATALTQFARQMGATIGVTLMGVIVNRGLPARRRAPRARRSTACRRPLRSDVRGRAQAGVPRRRARRPRSCG